MDRIISGASYFTTPTNAMTFPEDGRVGKKVRRQDGEPVSWRNGETAGREEEEAVVGHWLLAVRRRDKQGFVASDP
jgi:hypothetical protein